MQDHFKKQDNIEDILNQIRQKKNSEDSNPKPSSFPESLADKDNSSEAGRKPVFSPAYKENTEITFTTPPAVNIPAPRQKPKGPVFGAGSGEKAKEIPVPPPASNNKGHGVVTGLLNSLDRPDRINNQPTHRPDPVINEPIHNTPITSNKPKSVAVNDENNLQQPKLGTPIVEKKPEVSQDQSVSSTPQPIKVHKTIPHENYSPFSTSDTLLPNQNTKNDSMSKTLKNESKETHSTADTLLPNFDSKENIKNPIHEQPVAVPVVSETFTTPKKRTRKQEDAPKERIITKEVAKPTFKSLRELENDINAMENEPNSEISNASSDGKIGTGSIRVESFGDERFFEFFSETVAMDKTAMRAAAKGLKKKKTRRNYFNTESINTADIPISESFVAAESEETDQPFAEDIIEPIEVDDYNNLSDASGILHDLKNMTHAAAARFFITTILTIVTVYFSAALTFVLPLPELFSGEMGDSYIYYGIIATMLLSIAVAFPTFARGFTGLFSAPTQDTFVFLALLGAIAQSVVMVLTETSAIASSTTIFAPLAMLTYSVNSLGRWLQMKGITANFSIATEGFDHSAAYLVRNREAVLKLTSGIQEEYPELMLSRPTALVKNFLRQSFSPHESDRNGKRFGIALFFTAVAAAAITFYLSSGNVATITSVFAGVLVISAPLGAIFVQVLPTILMNRSASRVGAIIPGWEAIEGIGKTTAVMLNAHDIFPPTTVRLHGIKTFNKDQRIDLAILYAASILTKGCDTLRDIFLSMIEGKTEMLYEVESLTNEIGYGFTGWVDGKRINIGNRDMMERNDIALPSMDLENRFSKSERSVIYLAVSGKLYCMFLVSYVADEDISITLNILRQSGVSILVRSDDFNITRDLVSQKFQIAPENVKVLSGQEEEIAQRYTNYLPESEGLMTHFGSFTSFIGGLRAASAADSAERMAALLEAFTIVLSMILSVILTVTSGLHGLSMPIIVVYQSVWLIITILAILMKRY